MQLMLDQLTCEVCVCTFVSLLHIDMQAFIRDRSNVMQNCT